MDGEIKWESLEHNGVIFPPEYEPLPKSVKLIYDGKRVSLPPDAEEVAGFYAAMLETDHAKNPVFQKNFFNDFLKVLKESGGCKDADIKEFSKCDFSVMFAYFEQKRGEKKNLSAAEKKAIKLEKEAFEEKYKTCLLNGRKEQVGNFRIEPPGLFRGRGAHPKTGKLKRRVKPEDVVLNLSKDAPVPPPPEGHQWAEVRHDNNVSWLAMWRENISNSFKYVRFAANSSLKGMSDFKKFEKARELKYHIDVIRENYKKNLKSQLMLDRQIATATYLIDVFALRAGGEKSEEEADTVGCCSLRFEHVTLKPPNKVIFDFLGKDSIRFYQEVEVDPQVFKNLRIFKKAPKKPGDDLFDRLDPSILNKHLQNYMPGLTAKVFRTYNASKTMQDQLDLIKNEGTVNEKVVKFNAANRTVAILCNHQRTIAKGHEAGVTKIQDRIKEMVWQKIRFKKMMLQLDKKLLKKNPKFFEELDDISKEDEENIHKVIIEREKDKWEKKFIRDNEKRKLEGLEPLPKEELKEKLDKVKELEKEYKKELKTGKPEVKPSNITVEKLEAQIEKLDQRITNTTLQLKDKEDNSQVALGTSKINYIDPRLTVVFSKKFNVPIEKLFTKTLREKFNWAIQSADENWRF
ncbi:hypothetical protein PACTADRAFT_58616 [Pachysolen tannophilus NRRL Y-2460]|uniref:DNA topoisomerase I n=1 Tax=Pachysolen tannophilus NRRL Y-2460 TaxID=669874 RepID=A0A1E4TV49_PACTA|nr:hypothetical protein PACTADRAFT_58616 [Pachysolen tannophilus NRRL Y-2460]